MSKRSKRQLQYRNRVARLEGQLALALKRVEQLEEWQKAEIVIRALQQEGKEPEPGSAEWWQKWWKQPVLPLPKPQPVPGIFPSPPPLSPPQPVPYIGDPPSWFQVPVIYTGIGPQPVLESGITTDVKEPK